MKSPKTVVRDGITVKYHANVKSIHAKGKMQNGKPVGYWEWFRKDGTIKRSGTFNEGVPTGEWKTYDKSGEVVRVSKK